MKTTTNKLTIVNVNGVDCIVRNGRVLYTINRDHRGRRICQDPLVIRNMQNELNRS